MLPLHVLCRIREIGTPELVFSNKEILSVLAHKHSVVISIGTLKRLLPLRLASRLDDWEHWLLTEVAAGGLTFASKLQETGNYSGENRSTPPGSRTEPFDFNVDISCFFFFLSKLFSST